jgi:hypothetical protein
MYTPRHNVSTTLELVRSSWVTLRARWVTLRAFVCDAKSWQGVWAAQDVDGASASTGTTGTRDSSRPLLKTGDHPICGVRAQGDGAGVAKGARDAH